MALEGRNDILTDYWIPGPFVQTGVWTFEVEASLPEGEKEGGEGGGRRGRSERRERGLFVCADANAVVGG